ncbi:PEP/pyruvate-binding domain-containing protein [Gordonia sp. KTR9]|uniref:PEP/pyruvate-binding domain-containing protein n=1 Tax=Gordonia sp. KTR9 TaxID=337191 RepID=UPI00027DDC17|nr:PEP/pyruvate-binding domain-containing protein [Gordonia sp. KTR9]AFR48202.1 Phosphoenolpyruvate synthase / pyruvate phosphate dikinase [Gordonia sp. KTR9]
MSTSYRPESVAQSQMVLPLRECGSDRVHLVGGKALGLGELVSAGFAVPDGFVVTTAAYRRAIDVAGIGPKIAALLEQVPDDPAGQQEVSHSLSGLFSAEVIDDELRVDIRESYRRLGGGPVAVRSSAVAEDRADASFAGQQDTYLWIEGEASVEDAVIRCWASLFSSRVLNYRKRLSIEIHDVAMAVVVQRMVPARAAGVLMSLDPVNGDRSKIYLESSYGLGESVVSGEVTPDGFMVEKTSLAIESRVVGDKQFAHRYDSTVGEVVRTGVDLDERARLSLSDEEVTQIAELGRRVEAAFGYVVDVEWAIDENDNGIALLQARPETAWSSKSPASNMGQEEFPIQCETWDPLHSPSSPDLHWSTSNVAEAIPGVMTPLSWSLWGPTLERGARCAGFEMGVLSKREAQMTSDVNRHYFRSFYGRPALQVEYMALMGDRMPGTSGEEAVASILGRVPDGWQGKPTNRRVPIIAWKMARLTVTGPGRMRGVAAAVDSWYLPFLRRVDEAKTSSETAQLFAEAAEKFDAAVNLQVVGNVAVVVPIFTALERVVERSGKGDIAKLSGFGGAEVSGLVTDVWRASRGEVSLKEILDRIGFHGPMEGELSGTVWREDSSPLRDLIASYAREEDSADPRLKEAEHRRAATQSAAELLAATPIRQRPFVRGLLKLAAQRIPLRGVAKRALLQALDGARAAARKHGEFEVAAGRLRNTSDVFFLTASEIERLPADAQSLIDQRRTRHSLYETVTMPDSWKGSPVPEVASATDDSERSGVARVDGIGVSAGVVEGIARVLHTPDFSAVQAGEVLVTPTTDPSWSSVMLLSSALVVDIGGALSHAAVVARELGVPCVVNTRTGTKAIRTGDRVRVDGKTGVVQIISPASID